MLYSMVLKSVKIIIYISSIVFAKNVTPGYTSPYSSSAHDLCSEQKYTKKKFVSFHVAPSLVYTQD